jgi:hypothetical protein
MTSNALVQDGDEKPERRHDLKHLPFESMFCLPPSDIDVFAAPGQNIWPSTKESNSVDRHILTSVSSIKYSTFRHHVPMSLDARIMDWASQHDSFNYIVSGTLTIEGYIHSANDSIWQSHRKSSAEFRTSTLEDYSLKPAPE